MSCRSAKVLLAVSLVLVGLPALAGDGFQIDAVMVGYPEGYTKVLAMDVAAFLDRPELREAVLGPLQAANHPLVGVVRTVELLRIPLEQVAFVAHGEGPNLASFSLIQGPPSEATLGALQGLAQAARAPGSPFAHFDFERILGLPVSFAGGAFGPVAIEWAFIPVRNELWVGTEVAFQPGEPDAARLRATAERMAAKLQGRAGAGAMDELHVAIQVRGGEVGFVRVSAPGEKPLEPGEQAMGFALTVDEALGRVAGHFAVRFASREAAAAAAERLSGGTSPYLGQELYRAELVELDRSGRVLNFGVETDLRGLVGLLVLVMPF